MITILNTSILTEYGDYRYTRLTLSEARAKIQEEHQGNYMSAVGHQATADILTELLGVPVQCNRIEYRQGPGEEAIIFKLRARTPEGTILNREEVEKIGYEFGLLLHIGQKSR